VVQHGLVPDERDGSPVLGDGRELFHGIPRVWRQRSAADRLPVRGFGPDASTLALAGRSAQRCKIKMWMGVLGVDNSAHDSRETAGLSDGHATLKGERRVGTAGDAVTEADRLVSRTVRP
ncbi:MAG: hypothetical protein ACRDQ5_10865, partial [Sciscionella sp.]